MVRSKKEQEMLLGTLDMLILQTLITGPAHGHTIAQVIEHTSDDVLQIEQGQVKRGWRYDEPVDAAEGSKSAPAFPLAVP